MALDINALRAAFAKKAESKSDNGGSFWDKFFPFFRADIGQSSRFRFFPDSDEENPLGFIVPNQYHELMINGQKKKVACLKMYGESCPCCELSSKYYNEGDETMGKKFWRKIDYIAQGIPSQVPFEYPISEAENPIRLISLGPKLYKVVENKIVAGDLDEMPTDPLNGYDFIIAKTKQGEWADYSTSDFARKSTSVAEDTLARVVLYDLKQYRLPKVEREQMEAMIQSFLTGATYDQAQQQGSSNSFGHQTGNPELDTALNETKTVASADTVIQQHVAATPSAPTTSATGASGQKLSPAEILAKLRARSAGSAA